MQASQSVISRRDLTVYGKPPVKMLLWAAAALSCCCLLAQEVHSTTPQKLITSNDLQRLRRDYQSVSKINPPNRVSRSTEGRSIAECFEMISDEGSFHHSAMFMNETCAIYLFSEPDEKIEIRVTYLDVPCESGGLLVLLDGWEMNQEIFPSPADHPKPMSARILEVCGRRKVKEVLRTSQNAAMIMYKMTQRNSGFKFSVRIVKNPRPCNTLLQDVQALYTLRNYGTRSNCTLTAIYPAAVRVASLNVGVLTTLGRGIELETGTIHKVRLQCNKRGLDDYVQIGGTLGLDSSRLQLADVVCGLDSQYNKHTDYVNCGSTSIRLVSSGAFDNSVTVSIRRLIPEDLDSFASVTCVPFEENMK